MKPENGEHPWSDIGQLILLFCFIIVWAGDSFFLRISTFASDYLPFSIRLLLTAFAMIIAVYLAKSGHVVVNRQHPSARVISIGAFRYIRHPLYLASLLFYFGLAVSTACLFSFGLLVLIFFFYDHMAGYEEKLLQLKYGMEYIHYKKKTGKWLPRPKPKTTNTQGGQ